ncbi:hypothetical protein L3X38_039913 [Prunus dulcis]|uniref:Uncharacterized protein n=1 Tax=Prunus dulcis TaxID=3755 RepID=A0AAD4V803_PRUDU|nr:hypothetical protein L3X38_039913 [Prunus dulcis]
MRVDDFFNPHRDSTTDSFSHSPPTIVELSAQMAPLLQMQTLTPNPIQNQYPLLTTPTPTMTTTTPTPTPKTTPTPTPTPKTTPTPTPMITPTPNLSLIQTLIPISTPTPSSTQAHIPIPIPTQPVSYASSAAQIITSRLTTPTHGSDCAFCEIRGSIGGYFDKSDFQ